MFFVFVGSTYVEKILPLMETNSPVRAPVSAYCGLTTQGYENLSNNIADLKRYLSQLKPIVKCYREIDEEEE